MKGQMTIRQYRAIDLSLFSLMVMLSEALLVTAAVRWFPHEAYTVSATAALTAIVLIRWEGWAAIPAALGGLVFCLVSGGSPHQYLVYGAGNLLCLALLPVLRRKGDAWVREDVLRSMLFGLAVLLLMQAGRALISLLFGAGAAAVGFFTTDAVSMVFTLVVMWIVRRLDGVFENQYHYLRRFHREREREEGGNP